MGIGEVTWRRSSACQDETAMQIAVLGDTIVCRDPKDPAAGIQAYSRAEWTAFVAGAKAGDFDV